MVTTKGNLSFIDVILLPVYPLHGARRPITHHFKSMRYCPSGSKQTISPRKFMKRFKKKIESYYTSNVKAICERIHEIVSYQCQMLYQWVKDSLLPQQCVTPHQAVRAAVETQKYLII